AAGNAARMDSSIPVRPAPTHPGGEIPVDLQAVRPVAGSGPAGIPVGRSALASLSREPDLLGNGPVRRAATRTPAGHADPVAALGGPPRSARLYPGAPIGLVARTPRGQARAGSPPRPRPQHLPPHAPLGPRPPRPGRARHRGARRETPPRPFQYVPGRPGTLRQTDGPQRAIMDARAPPAARRPARHPGRHQKGGTRSPPARPVRSPLPVPRHAGGPPRGLLAPAPGGLSLPAHREARPAPRGAPGLSHGLPGRPARPEAPARTLAAPFATRPSPGGPAPVRTYERPAPPPDGAQRAHAAGCPPLLRRAPALPFP